jgi:hypothetical protein
MGIQNHVSAPGITILIVLLGTAGCLSRAPASAPQTAPVIVTDNTSTNMYNAATPDDSDSGITSAPDSNNVSSDPVSGQSGEVNLGWEQLCLSSEYQVQIAKDSGFTMIVLDTGSYAPASTQSPGAYYPAGGSAASPSSVTGWANLEAGHTYYWRARVREAATGQHMLSPWSEAQSFTVEPGTQTSATSYGIQPTSPANGTNAYPITQASFNWTPLMDTTKYRFLLAKDAALTEVIADAVVTTTAYNYQGELEFGQAYFWKVMALEPAPSDWSATFTFRTQPAPPSVPAAAAAAPLPPIWAIAIIFIGLILLIVVIILILRMRRR